jgi:eukaryotic-like serine/threonine-protein kinase
MADNNWQKVREVFDSALCRQPEERQNFVNEACGEDKILLAEVESLLSSLGSAESFMETPAIAKVADVIEGRTKKLETGKCFGHYEIIRQIGAGGMGEVYLAKDKKLDREVAVKILKAEFSQDESNLYRFIREAKAASSLNHPTILVIHEIGEHENTHYIVSEFINGKTLREILREKTLKLPEVLDISIQIADALCTAHSSNIIHRDIKPENIVVRPDGVVKVLDFGLAKLVEEKNRSIFGLEESNLLQTQTAKGVILGTVSYMSPEQARGKPVDARTDIFSFGILLYEMLTGEQPFTGETVNHTIVAILEKEPPPVSQFINSHPPEIERIIKKCLAKKADDRYSVAKSLLDDLKELKDELAFQSKLERSSAPNKRAEAERQIIKAATIAKIEAKNSIAILPFANMSNEAENEYFCDGLAEELLNALAKIEDLKVAARTSAFSFKNKNVAISEIGKTLNVKTVLEGSVRRSGNRLRISVQLVNAADGYQLWSERYDREMKDIFDVQDEITLAVVDALKVKLFGEEKAAILKRYTDNPEAYELYLKGLYHSNKWTDEGIRKSIEYFEKALEKDPEFAPAYAKIADYYHFSSHLGLFSPQEILPKWKAAAQRALEIDEGLADAHLAMAHIYFYYERDWAKAEREFERAVKLNPNSTDAHKYYGLFLASRERIDQAVTEGKKALALDPLSIAVNIVGGFIYLFVDRLDDAFGLVRQMIELDSNAPQGYWVGGSLLMANGKYEEAVEAFQKSLCLGDNQMALAKLGCAYGLAGRRDEALKILDQLFEMRERQYAAPFNIARVYAGLGDNDNAFEWMEKAIEERDADLVFLKRYVEAGAGVYFGETFSTDLRYEDILRRAGLPTHEIAAGQMTDETSEAQTAVISTAAINDKEISATVLKTNEQTWQADKPKGKLESSGRHAVGNSTEFLQATTGDANLKTAETQNTFSIKQHRALAGFALLAILIAAIGLSYHFFSTGKSALDADGKKSIAVLPLKPINTANRDQIYELGIADSVILKISSSRNLIVRQLHAVRNYVELDRDLIEIGKEQNVDFVLASNYQIANGKIKVTSQLLDVGTGKVEDTFTVEKDSTDLFSAQEAIAGAIGSKLIARFGGATNGHEPKRGTISEEAYRLYLQGMYLVEKGDKAGTKRSIELFDQAIDLDPNFAAAWAGKGYAHCAYSHMGDNSPAVEYEIAGPAIERALKLDSNLPEAYAVLGIVNTDFRWNFAEGEKHFLRAIELNPSSDFAYRWYGNRLVRYGRTEEAVAAMKTAIDNNPTNIFHHRIFGWVLYMARRHDEAIEELERVVEMDPSSPWTYENLWLAYHAKGEHAQAFEWFMKFHRQAGTGSELINRFNSDYQNTGWQGVLQTQKAILKAEEQKGAFSPLNYKIAMLSALVGDKDQALESLNEAFIYRSANITFLKTDPALDSLRGDPRFHQLMQRAGF